MTRRLTFVIVAIGVIAATAFFMRDSDEPQLIRTDSFTSIDDSEFEICFDCHDDLNAHLAAGTVALADFRHEQHFSDSGFVGCGNCHGLDTHDQTPPRTPEMEDCFNCHIDEGIAPVLPCLRCHDTTTVFPPQSHFSADWKTIHGSGALLSPALCETCHSREAFCTACHGTDIPHQSDWATYPHARATFEAGIDSCGKCHERGPGVTVRDDCDTCHHPWNQEVPEWRVAHREVVKADGAGTCFECHDPDTCVKCHTTGEEDFSADFNRLEIPDEGEDAPSNGEGVTDDDPATGEGGEDNE